MAAHLLNERIDDVIKSYQDSSVNEFLLIKRVEQDGLVAFRYIDDKGEATTVYPQNPNGSTNAIAGVTDPTGRVLGLMPHPEKFVETTQHPNWRRPDFRNRQAGFIIKNMIEFAKAS